MVNQINTRELKSLAIKGIRLQKYFDAYKEDNQNQEVLNKFVNVWGSSMAAHFLINYDNAEALIWAFDSNNLELFIEKF